MTRAYYNDDDPYCARWLRNLIARGLIADGDVDDRDIRDVRPSDLRGYRQAHFFAGLGGWSYALRLAGWPDDRAVWTGSCPCQPFSAAGAQKGFADERHLWPDWHWLIEQCRPPIVFGEQVARASDWLALVHRDLETLGYAVGAIPIEAACVGAWQLRDRFWFVASDDSDKRARQRLHLQSRRQDETPPVFGWQSETPAGTDGDQLRQQSRWGSWPHGQGALLTAGAHCSRRADSSSKAETSAAWHAAVDMPDRRHAGFEHWRVEPSVDRLVHGLPGRVGAVRAFGNAIVPQVAAEFIRAVM